MLKMNALKFLVFLSLALAVVAIPIKCKWGVSFRCRPRSEEQDDSRSALHIEDWPGFPETFLVPDKRGLPDESVTSQNKMDSAIKKGKRAPRYEVMKAYLEDLYP
ncbi:hypothetical protein ACROYT_G023840 [Oculina patagonica]